MKSSAETVTDYVAESTGEWQPAINRLRALCRDCLHGYQEAMAYGMPTYTSEGRPEIAFARQVSYFSLYVMKKDVLDGHRSELRGIDLGKGCIRYRRPEQIDWTLVEVLLRETATSTASPC